MDDKTIIQHYWDRDETALTETDEKYGRFCSSIADNILKNREDTKECLNDTYLKTWNTIPTQRPEIFPAFLGKIVRNLAVDRYRMSGSEKRGGGQTEAVLEELDECLPDRSAEIECEVSELSIALDEFLETLPEKKRKILVLRYWYTESVQDIASELHMSESNVSATLNRLRKKLQSYLTERGRGR